MASSDGDRSKFFPAIEKKHGEKITVWINRLKELETTKYPEQIAFLKENHGFSQAHANALVMYVRGSTTSKRFDDPEAFFKKLDPQARKTVKAIFTAIMAKHKNLELVIAWNQPMLRIGKDYILGISVSQKHITLNPFSKDVLDQFSKRLAEFKVSKHTFQVPLDWKVDASLLNSLAKARLSEIKGK